VQSTLFAKARKGQDTCGAWAGEDEKDGECGPRADYSGFNSALYRKLDAEWHFSQENATLHDFKRATVESKPL
jgi:hypothetical protein